MYEVATIPFKDTPGFLSVRNVQSLIVYVVPRNICDLFGIDRKTQQRKLIENPGKWDYRTIWAQLPGDDRKRSLAVIPDTKVRTWICSINPEKVRSEVRENLISFQQECDQVLCDYWTKGIAVNPRSSFSITPEFQDFIGEVVSISVKQAIREITHTLSDTFVNKNTFVNFAENCTQRLKALENPGRVQRRKALLPKVTKINLQQAQSLRDLVKEKGKTRRGICHIWKEFRKEFALDRYGDLLEKDFQAALRWLNCM